MKNILTFIYSSGNENTFRKLSYSSSMVLITAVLGVVLFTVFVILVVTLVLILESVSRVVVVIPFLLPLFT